MPAHLTFGTFIAPYHRLGDNPLLSMRRDLELIQWCDELGLDEAWVGEHHSAAWENIGDPVVFLAAPGDRTKHIQQVWDFRRNDTRAAELKTNNF